MHNLIDTNYTLSIVRMYVSAVDVRMPAYCMLFVSSWTS